MVRMYPFLLGGGECICFFGLQNVKHSRKYELKLIGRDQGGVVHSAERPRLP